MRLGRLIRGDIHFQWKYGFYFIYTTLQLFKKKKYRTGHFGV